MSANGKGNTGLRRFDLRLRPHLIIDIVTGYGNNFRYEPHPYGHSQHIVAARLLSNPFTKIRLVLESDDICKGCIHLMSDGKCDDILAQLRPSPSKQAYNDILDCRLFDHFKLEPGTVITFSRYLEILNNHTPGLEEICTHPKEDPEKRLKGLANGLARLGNRKSV